MNHHKIISVIIFFGMVMLHNSDKSNNIPEVTGTYISTTPGLSDKLTIMYIRGHFNFLYSGPGQQKLKLKNDKSFIYSFTTCKNGIKDRKGKWELYKKKLVLNYTDKRSNQIFNISDNMIYCIDSTRLIENNKYMPYLSLLEKQ